MTVRQVNRQRRTGTERADATPDDDALAAIAALHDTHNLLRISLTPMVARPPDRPAIARKRPARAFGGAGGLFFDAQSSTTTAHEVLQSRKCPLESLISKSSESESEGRVARMVDFGHATLLDVKANFAERGIRSMPIEFQNSHGSFSPACML
jgi:hypothetical protein